MKYNLLEEGWIPVKVGANRRIVLPITDETIREGEIILIKIRKAEIKPKEI